MTEPTSNNTDSALTVDAFDKARRLLGPPPDTREIFVSPFATRQYRFPRSKKRRIRDKWSKRSSNSKPAAFSTATALFIHPALMELVSASLVVTPPCHTPGPGISTTP